MADLRLGVAFAGVIITALVFLQLLSVVQYHHDISPPSPSFSQAANEWIGRANKAADNDLFLVGAGKADVTGSGSISLRDQNTWTSLEG